MTKEEAHALLRRIMGPPCRVLEGKEQEQILFLLTMIEPYSATNNQHSYTEYYILGNKEYHVTTFLNEDEIVEEILNEIET
jgi:hypothetical protein